MHHQSNNNINSKFIDTPPSALTFYCSLIAPLPVKEDVAGSRCIFVGLG